MLLNFFDDFLDKIYYSTTRPIAEGKMSIALVVTLACFVLSLFCFIKTIKKDDKKPIKWGWAFLTILLLIVSILYSYQAIKAY